jgi:hypothetical protein
MALGCTVVSTVTRSRSLVRSAPASELNRILGDEVDQAAW